MKRIELRWYVNRLLWHSRLLFHSVLCKFSHIELRSLGQFHLQSTNKLLLSVMRNTHTETSSSLKTILYGKRNWTMQFYRTFKKNKADSLCRRFLFLYFSSSITLFLSTHRAQCFRSVYVTCNGSGCKDKLFAVRTLLPRSLFPRFPRKSNSFPAGDDKRKCVNLREIPFRLYKCCICRRRCRVCRCCFCCHYYCFE